MNNLSLRVLLVDDDDEDRQLIRLALTNAISHILIEEMTSGQELIAWLAQERSLTGEESVVDPHDSVTVILLDMHMPKLTGLETLHYLGDMSDLPYIPVIMLTASISDQLKQQAYQRGIHLFMLKPTGANGFYRIVEAVKLCYRDAVRIREQNRLKNDFY